MPGKDTIRGYVEKKKDWIERSRDYKKKSNKLRRLRQKAKDRNPDEFHFHMINSKIRVDGIHEEFEKSDDETEIQKLFSDITDLQYVTHKLSLERKKIEKLRSVLHFPTTSTSKSRIIFVDSIEEAKSVKSELANAESLPPSTNELAQSQYLELEKRIARANELKIVMEKLQLKKRLALSKKSELKPKLIKKGSQIKAAVYQWTFERKK